MTAVTGRHSAGIVYHLPSDKGSMNIDYIVILFIILTVTGQTNI